MSGVTGSRRQSVAAELAVHPTSAGMVGHFTLQRRAAYMKWLVFGVGLPLLPFAGRALAASIDRGGFTWSSLLGDGELLVIATVLATAVIGDLLFDFTGLAGPTGQLRVATRLRVGLVWLSMHARQYSTTSSLAPVAEGNRRYAGDSPTPLESPAKRQRAGRRLAR